MNYKKTQNENSTELGNQRMSNRMRCLIKKKIKKEQPLKKETEILEKTNTITELTHLIESDKAD